MNNHVKIKYDKKTHNLFKKITFISLGMIVLGIIFMFILTGNIELERRFRFLISSSLYLLFAGVPLFIFFFYKTLDSQVYLGRLRKNGFEVPEDASAYDKMLANVPRHGETIENRYGKDSIISFILFAAGSIGFGLADLLFYLKWIDHESDCILFVVMILIGCLVFAALSLIFMSQANRKKYVDRVDVKAPGDTRKIRSDIFTSAFIFVVLSLVGIFTLMTAESMTNYIYKSKHGGYDLTMSEFIEGAAMEVTSDDLTDGVWSEELAYRAPQLSFEEVEGAEYYVVYMVNETDGYSAHWYIDDLNETYLAGGNDEGIYINLDKRVSYLGNTYSITVYAMAGKNDSDIAVVYDESSFNPCGLYRMLDITRYESPTEYGNVLAYGYISGTFTG